MNGWTGAEREKYTRDILVQNEGKLWLCGDCEHERHEDLSINEGLLTLCGISLYIIYSYQLLAETERLVGPEGLAYVHTSFGRSLDLAWISYGLELLTGTLLLVAARLAKLQHSSFE